MIRFTIRELLLITIVAGVAVAWWQDRRQLQGVVSRLTIEQRFEKDAELWEDWCESKWYDSRFHIQLEDDSYRRLADLGKDAVPYVFNRWALNKDESPRAVIRTPPWWFMLERLTGKKLVSDEKKLAGLPKELQTLIKPADIDVPELQKNRWLQWWESEGRKAYPACAGK